MTFFAFGINHETAPVEVREAFAVSEEARRAFYRRLALPDSAELILLSTCNRTEGYLFGTEADVAAVTNLLSASAGQPWPEREAFRYQDEDAIRHLLQVACGLRSMVLGDAQILAQVKDAYRIAVEEERVGTVLHRLLHSTFRAAKRVAAETALSSGAASISSAAVALARTRLEQAGRGGLDGARVLILGTGKMGRLALQSLSRFDLAGLSVANRSRERAALVAEVAGADVVDWEARHAAAAAADVVIVATGSDKPVLYADRLSAKSEHDAGTLLIDIAVPRNVDEAVAALPGYTVLELNALHAWTQQVDRTRRAEVPRAEQICEELLAEFVSWMFHQQALQPVVQAIRDTFDDIRLQEIERHQHRFTDADYAELDRLTRSIMQKLLAIPIVRLKSVDPESIDFVRGVRLLQHLFSRPGCEGTPLSDVPGPADQAAGVPSSACPVKEHDDARRLEDDLANVLSALESAARKQPQA
ncbi:MAG TPA: glutamyl-tRNA reductase [Rhodothermales bacterium]|nr:glutamyl-tRNA reductase [Rhodothermales bacterium]